MNLREVLEKRYSARSYLPKEIETGKIDYILECVRLAPSASNKQPWMLYVVATEEKKELIRKTYYRDWFKTAPLYIVVCGDHSQSWKRNNTDKKDHCDIDVSIACEHICLAVEDIGLGTCWICNFDPSLLKEVLQFPDHIEPVAIFPIAYVDESKNVIPEKKRKAMDEIAKWI